MTQAYSKHDCKIELREVSLKATPTRLAVLGLLEKANKPVDVASIIDYLKGNNIQADPVTVFRIVNLFTEKGLTRQVHLNEGKFRYELFAKDDHHHLKCENCGTIEDVADCGVDTLIKEIQKQKKFKVKNHSLEFYGLCAHCQK